MKTMLAAALLLASVAATAATPTRPGAAINLDQRKLTNSEFQALPDAQAIIFKGQTLTVGEARQRMKLVIDEARAHLKTVGQGLRPKFLAAQKTFLGAQQAALAKRNAQGLAAYEQRFQSASTMAPILKR